MEEESRDLTVEQLKETMFQDVAESKETDPLEEDWVEAGLFEDTDIEEEQAFQEEYDQEDQLDENILSMEDSLPNMVQWKGEAYSMPTLVTDATFGRRAAEEVLQLRQETEILDEYATVSGIDRQQVLCLMRQQMEQMRTEKVVEEQGLPPELAQRFIAEQRRREEAEAALQAQLQQQAQYESQGLKLYDLFSKYPELYNPDNMPREVKEVICEGGNPLMAYENYLFRQQQTQSLVQKQRQKIRAKSPGSASGAGDVEVDDDALAAFDAVMKGFI